MTLAEAQTAFHALATHAPAPPRTADELLVGTGDLPATERMEIYANMYLWRLADALREDFPNAAALLGDERFLALAEAYAREHPSDHPDLGQFGRHLPAFLRAFQPSSRDDLADLATLEWARSEVFFEAPAQSATHAGFEALGPDTFLGARLELIPAVRLLILDHDAAAVWRRLEDGDPPLPPATVVTAIAVWRRGYEVFHARIDLDEAHALEAALADEPLVRVCAWFEDREDPAAAAFAALSSWTDEGWLAAIHA
ncbi:DNA-binding domain-containing protein [Anaeromyxobacter sp. Fw109-5]|uniref:HvfC/BufC N-terminal domain-containing protein n=1 Tax=Anaeromyxobacter sp. (strain Fw109-5) TaxID=404589 RepID=UPI0000ED7D86|nr:DNA-binding domain-containing protein [Anaeromyxobacter sp. Fw109-5]ABS25761.1 conserved hypothetical protein [Anaeromyxobacter sp. Fw109-5]